MKIKFLSVTSLWIIFLIGFIYTILSPSIWACNIPVFQYALEYWDSDLYELIVFYRKELSAEEQTILNQLSIDYQESNIYANVAVRKVDLAKSPDETVQQLWKNQPKSELPWIVAKYPRFSGISKAFWSGPLTSDIVDVLTGSPVRKEVARRIMNGEAAVWILLESGIEKKDQEAARFLENQLKKMEKELKIPVPDVYAYSDTQTTEQSVDFSMLRLSRNKPSERIFVQMLVNIEEDLKTISEPMVFPVFGRGRMLYPLVGDGINEENIMYTCSFLVGWCSCQIKALNPGVDLLMSTNWMKLIDEKLAGKYSETSTEFENPQTTLEVETEDSNSLSRNILIVVSIQILIVGIVTLVVIRRRKQRS